MLGDIVAAAVDLVDDHILDGALITIVGIDRFIIVACQDQVFGVHGSTEKLNAVIRIVVNLNVLNDGAVTDAAKSDAVQLIVWRQLEARILDLNVAQYTRTIAHIIAAIERVW